VLLIAAAAIGIATVTYTNYLASKISVEEKRKAKLWADAIEKRARLLSYTYDLFNKLAKDERQKVQVWAQSTKFILTVEDNDLLTFFNDIITTNNNIPVILADESLQILATRNVEYPGVDTVKRLEGKLMKEFSSYPPIIVQYRSNRNFIYYKDSNLFQELKNNLNDLVAKFISEVVVNTTISPVILTDEKGNAIAFGNIDSTRLNTPEKLHAAIASMKENHEPILLELGDMDKKFIYFDDSVLLRQLRWFPYIQLGIFGVFILIAYFAFSNARKAEQNLVWVGMAKETAHQLGTPISSLSSWVEYLKETEALKGSEHILQELDADINRLTLVADRFSKIGSAPKLEAQTVDTLLDRNIKYMQARISTKVKITKDVQDSSLSVKINDQLFDWVLENLFKNAIDAMEGEGSIEVKAFGSGRDAVIEIKDSGCGIPRARFTTVFEPGFSTKRRGWGLGLSLTKRIVESYHSGKIFVKESELAKSTTFRIELPKA
jgi:two-component system, sporulation sensor kinase D